MHRLNISYKQFYVTLNEIWLFESDPNAPSTWSEPGGKQWQRSIRGRRNWDVELGPCAVIRHLCSVAFVWETKRPQADNSRSLIDRQVSCSSFFSFFLCFCHSTTVECLKIWIIIFCSLHYIFPSCAYVQVVYVFISIIESILLSCLLYRHFAIGDHYAPKHNLFNIVMLNSLAIYSNLKLLINFLFCIIKTGN